MDCVRSSLMAERRHTPNAHRIDPWSTSSPIIITAIRKRRAPWQRAASNNTKHKLVETNGGVAWMCNYMCNYMAYYE